MAPDQVRALLGEPLRVEPQGDATCWYYQEGPSVYRDGPTWVLPRGSVLFAPRAAGRPATDAWKEP